MGHRDIPELVTNRLVLKGPQPEDYPNFKATFTSFRARARLSAGIASFGRGGGPSSGIPTRCGRLIFGV